MGPTVSTGCVTCNVPQASAAIVLEQTLAAEVERAAAAAAHAKRQAEDEATRSAVAAAEAVRLQLRPRRGRRAP